MLGRQGSDRGDERDRGADCGPTHRPTATNSTNGSESAPPGRFPSRRGRGAGRTDRFLIGDGEDLFELTADGELTFLRSGVEFASAP